MVAVKSWRHPHSAIAGAIIGGAAVSGSPWLFAGYIAFVLAAGAATTLLLTVGWRFWKRIDRALPDSRFHPCATCTAPIEGRNRYCSDTCRTIAAERRMRDRVHAERMADTGGVPF